MSKRSLLSAVVALLAGVVAITAGGAGGQEGSLPIASESSAAVTVEQLQAASPATGGQGANYRPAGWHDPSNDATERFDAPAIETDLQARLGDRYAGMWGAGPKFKVAIVNPTVEDLRLVAAYGEVVPARFSLTQLEQWKDDATGVLSAAGGDFGVGVDLVANHVVIDSNHAEAHRGAFEAKIPHDALDLHNSFHAVDTHADRFHWLAYIVHQEAGLAVYFPDRNVGCTTGWYLWSSAYGPFGSSAGHCEGTGHPARAWDGVWQGTVNNNTDGNGTSSDANVFSTNNISNYARVQNQSSNHWGVMGQFSNTWPRSGESACWSGAVGSNTDVCGTVSRYDYTVTSDGTTRYHNYCVNVYSNPGDSGGPMYRLYSNGTVRAMGMLSTRVDGVGACGSHIVHILSATGMSLPTSPW